MGEAKEGHDNEEGQKRKRQKSTCDDGMVQRNGNVEGGLGIHTVREMLDNDCDEPDPTQEAGGSMVHAFFSKCIYSLCCCIHSFSRVEKMTCGHALEIVFLILRDTNLSNVISHPQKMATVLNLNIKQPNTWPVTVLSVFLASYDVMTHMQCWNHKKEENLVTLSSLCVWLKLA